jgi:hypothetical protein
MKKIRIAYWISTGLITALMLMSVGMYIFNHEVISKVFENMNYPSYIIYPLATAKIFGLIAIWVNKFKALKEWAYAGFFFDFVLAIFAHAMIGEDYSGALMAVVFILISYFSWVKLDRMK